MFGVVNIVVVVALHVLLVDEASVHIIEEVLQLIGEDGGFDALDVVDGAIVLHGDAVDGHMVVEAVGDDVAEPFEVLGEVLGHADAALGEVGVEDTVFFGVEVEVEDARAY